MWGQLMFSEGSGYSCQMLSYFHDYSLGVILFILIIVFGISSSIMSSNMLSSSAIVSLVEVIWTVLPMVILAMLVIPSLQILYLVEEELGAVELKVLGSQWYWSYEYGECAFSSYMLPKGDFRLLDVDHRCVLPFGSSCRALISGLDVIHCWSLPAVGVKVDAVPGRINQLFFCFLRPTVAYGQCSEICGANHSFMPISVEAIMPSSFLEWIQSQ